MCLTVTGYHRQLIQWALYTLAFYIHGHFIRNCLAMHFYIIQKGLWHILGYTLFCSYSLGFMYKPLSLSITALTTDDCENAGLGGLVVTVTLIILKPFNWILNGVFAFTCVYLRYYTADIVSCEEAGSKCFCFSSVMAAWAVGSFQRRQSCLQHKVK